MGSDVTTPPHDPIAKLQASVEALHAKIDAHFHGDPNAGQPGVWIRIDRIEQRAKGAVAVAMIALGAATTAVVSAFTGHK